MNKILAVLKREYLQAVRKKMFIVMTFLLPFLIAGMFMLPTLMMAKGVGAKRVAVLDGTGELRKPFENPDSRGDEEDEGDEGSMRRRARETAGNLDVEYIDRKGDAKLDDSAKPYLDRLTAGKGANKLDGVLLVPADALTNRDARLKYYSRSATDFVTQSRVSNIANRSVQRFRLASRGIAPDDIEGLLKEMRVDAVQLSRSGQQKKGGVAMFLAGFALIGLLLIPSFIYGLEIMRGIIQEKTDRVVEVLVSSMKPSQLLIGKIVGVAAVGLTQVSVWLLMAGAAAAYAATVATFAGKDVLSLLQPMFFVYFVIFFVLAYLTYVCIYAIGGAVCNSEKEAQQLIAPITMIMMLPWFLMGVLITNPDSPLAVGFSLAPVFGPLTMFVRTLVSEPPIWHVLLSIAISIATISAMFWVTAKIFRVGILSYGKRPTLPELWRWVKVA